MCLVLICCLGESVLCVELSCDSCVVYMYCRSMLPDVIDDAALASDVRREELFYAYFVFGNKFAGGVTLGISTAIYK